MKIAMISDTHGLLPDPSLFEGADLILYAGDIGPDRGVEEWINKQFRPWCNTLNEMGIEFWATYGNHDDPKKWGVHPDLPIVVDGWRILGDLKVWFSPWSVRFGDWHWMLDETRLTEKYAQIPVNCKIVGSHKQMFQARDANVDGTLCGSKALRVRMRELTSPKSILICGHIHESHGYADTEFADVYNVASLYGLNEPNRFGQQREEPITWLEL